MKRTHLIFILDRSGSMSGLEEDTIGGYNQFLQKYSKHKNTIVSTILFDHEQVVLYHRVNILQAKLTQQDYEVRGSTALLDTIGQTISTMHNQDLLDKDTEQRVYIITTDGMENSSREYSYSDIHKMISSEREKSHEVLFLGANIDIAKEAKKLGIDQTYAHLYQSTKDGTKDMYKQMNMMISKAVKK